MRTLLDDRLTVTSISGTSGSSADSDGNNQTVEWNIASLTPGGSATITVSFEVDQAVEEANGVGRDSMMKTMFLTRQQWMHRQPMIQIA